MMRDSFYSFQFIKTLRPQLELGLDGPNMHTLFKQSHEQPIDKKEKKRRRKKSNILNER